MVNINILLTADTKTNLLIFILTSGDMFSQTKSMQTLIFSNQKPATMSSKFS